MRKAPIIIISPTMAFLIPSKACPTSPGLELVIYLKPEATNTATVIAPNIPKRALIIPEMRAVILLNLLGFINPTVCGELASAAELEFGVVEDPSGAPPEFGVVEDPSGDVEVLHVHVVV
jgi:hypothetical protein